MRLLSLPEAVLKLIEAQKLSAGHAKILVGLDNAEFVANKIIEKNLSVRQSENFVKIFKTKKHSLKPSKDINLQVLENSIREKIGLNVLIKNKKNNSGSLLLEYKDRLPIRGNYTIITIDKYTIQIDNVQDTYVISNLFEEVEPGEPVTLESVTAEGAPSWAIAAITALEQSTKEE